MQSKHRGQSLVVPRRGASTSQSGVKLTPNKGAQQQQVPGQKRASSTPLVDLVLGSATSSDSAKRPTLQAQIQKHQSPTVPRPVAAVPASAQKTSVKVAPKLFDLFPGTSGPAQKPNSRSVVYLRDKSGTPRNLEAKLIKVIKNQKRPLVGQGVQARPVAKVQMTAGKAGERHMLSITRPRSSTIGHIVEKAAPVASNPAVSSEPTPPTVSKQDPPSAQQNSAS
uniref:Uncharacterized protein n=1 Tax=Ciona savignyi TaxID=51511 RepID=H2YES1_CIOSA